MNDEKFGICDYRECNLYLTDAVTLPCWNTVCSEHLNQIEKNYSSYKCIACEKEHSIPQEECFPVNIKMQQLVDFYVKSDKKRRECFDSIDKLIQQINEYDSIKPHEFIDKHIQDLGKKINEEREILIGLINQRANKMLNKLDEMKIEWKSDVENAEIKKFKDEFSDEKVNEWKKLIKTSNVEEQTLTNLSFELKKKIDDLKEETLKLRLNINKEIELDENKSRFIQFIEKKIEAETSLYENLKKQENDKIGLQYTNIIDDAGAILTSLNEKLTRFMCIGVCKDQNKLISGSVNGELKLYDLHNGECLKTSAHTNEVTFICVLNHETFATVNQFEYTIKLWNLETFECSNTFKNYARIFSLSFISDSQLAIGLTNGIINIWNFREAKLEKSFQAHGEKITCLTKTDHVFFSSIQKMYMISASHDKKIKLWDLDTLEFVKELNGHTDNINYLELTKDNEKLLSSSCDCQIKLWNLNTGDCLKTIHIQCQSIKLYKEHMIIASGNLVIVYDFDQFKKIFEFNNGDWINSMKINENNGNLITCDDKNIKQWKLFSTEKYKF